MKKLLVKFSTIIMIFALTLSLAGCSLFSSSTDGVDGGNSSAGGNEATQQPTVQTLNKAEFGRIDGDRVVKDKVNIISSVRGSVVSIIAGESAGSGVIVDLRLVNDSGVLQDSANEFYILTCHHVISGKGDIAVYLPDAENDNVGESDYDEASYTFTGTIGGAVDSNSGKAVTLVGGDEKSDIAVLKLTIANSEVASRIVKAKFPPSEGYQMAVGEDVIAIGNPGGDLPGTASFGTISYINRETAVGGIGNITLLQINVDIYHGSSGGGLFNMYGELIGITSAGRDGTASSDGSVVSYSGLNFAVPYVVDPAKGTSDFGFMNVAGLLLATKTSTNYGYVPGRVGLFGFTTGEANSTVQITDVTVGSVAERAGLKRGDVIKYVEKGGQIGLMPTQVTTNAQVSAVFASLSVGDSITVQVYRQSTNSTHTVTMTATQYRFCDTGA